MPSIVQKLTKWKRLIRQGNKNFVSRTRFLPAGAPGFLFSLINRKLRVYKNIKVSLQEKIHLTILLRDKKKQRAGVEPCTPLTYTHVLSNIVQSNLHRKRMIVMLA